MKIIYKYPLPRLTGKITVLMPRDALVRHVAGQGGRVCLWAEVDVGNPASQAPRFTSEERDFFIYGTGWALPDVPGTYLGTAHADDGTVWHVYEPE